MTPDRIVIRPVREEDADGILRIYEYYIRETAVTFECEVPSADDFRRRVKSISAVYPYLVCLIDGKPAGYAYAVRQRERAAYAWNAELSVYVEESYQRRGIARALYTCLMEILALQHVRNVYGGVTLPNPGSEKLHGSFGFRKAGTFRRTGYKLGRWRDVAWYEKSIGTDGSAPAPFCPVGEIGGSAVAEITGRCRGMIAVI